MARFKQSVVIKMMMSLANDHFQTARKNREPYGYFYGALSGIRSCLYFMEAEEEVKRIDEMQRLLEEQSSIRREKDGGTT